MKTLGPMLALLVCSNFLGCAGTETTNPLKAFQGSECKMHLLGSNADTTAVALTLDDDAGSADDGGVNVDAGTMPPTDAVVSCISYEETGDQLHLTAMNFSAPCGIMSWQGGGHFEGDTLVVQSKNANKECSIAACGSCIYDFVYDVAGAPTDQSIPLQLEVGGCVDGDNINVHITKLDLPTDRAKSGTVCRDSAGTWKLR